jgi:hypothetical protein
VGTPSDPVVLPRSLFDRLIEAVISGQECLELEIGIDKGTLDAIEEIAVHIGDASLSEWVKDKRPRQLT